MPSPDGVAGEPPEPHPGEPEPPAPRDFRLQMYALSIVAFFGYLGFKLGGSLPDDNGAPRPPDAVLAHAGQLALMAGAVFGFAMGFAVIPKADDDLSRVFTARGLTSLAVGVATGALLCLLAALLYWGGWRVLDGPLAATRAAQCAGGASGVFLGLSTCAIAARWVLPRLVAAEITKRQP